jgi:glycosyltransferase involved in cell wall biosynthesis
LYRDIIRTSVEGEVLSDEYLTSQPSMMQIIRELESINDSYANDLSNIHRSRTFRVYRRLITSASSLKSSYSSLVNPARYKFALRRIWAKIEGGAYQKVSPATPVMIARKRIRVLCIGDGPIASTKLTFDYSIVPAVSSVRGEVKITYGDRSLETVSRDFDIVFVMRLVSASAVKYVEDLSAYKIPVVYLIDDDFELIDEKYPLGAHYISIGAHGNVRKIMNTAKASVFWSEELRKKFESECNEAFTFNAIANLELMDRIGSVGTARDGGLVIGYAGSQTHAKDLLLLKDVILKALSAHPHVRFETIGQNVEWLNGHPQYNHIPPVDNLEGFYQLMLSRRWDIGLAPLVDTKFNRSKTDNKYREYSAARIPGVYSKIPPFDWAVKHGETGFLAEGASEWYDCLAQLIENADLRARISYAARRDVEARCSTPAVARQFVDLIQKYVAPVRVLAVGATHLPTFCIDINGPFSLLERQGRCVLRSRDIAEVSEADITWADVVVIVRAFEPDALGVAMAARKARKWVIYSLDDNWFEFPKNDTSLAKHINSEVNQASLVSMVKTANLVKATTNEIKNSIIIHNKNCVVRAYGFDFELAPDRPTPRDCDYITIGYFGTVGRDDQFDIAIEALRNLQSVRSDIRLEFLGFNPKRAGELENVTNISFLKDYRASIELLRSREWDIGLSPLDDNIFNRSKLPTKFRDYAAIGAAGIYSRIESYSSVVRNGKTGLLVGNTVREWTDALIGMCENKQLRENIAREAYREVRISLSAERAAEEWYSLFRDIGVAGEKV